MRLGRCSAARGGEPGDEARQVLGSKRGEPGDEARQVLGSKGGGGGGGAWG